MINEEEKKENIDFDSMEYLPGHVYTVTEIMNMRTDPNRFLWDIGLRKNGIAVIMGSADSGKSYLCLDLARAICSDESHYLGFPINRKHGSAIIVSSEDTVEDIKERIEMMDPSKIKLPDALRFIFDFDGKLQVKLDEELTRQPADLVVIDTFGDFFRGDINSSIPIRSFFEPFKKLSFKHNCLFLFNNHIGKGKENNFTPSKNDILGSEGIVSACRTVLHLKKSPDGKRILTVVKGNHLPDTKKNKGLILDFDVRNGFTAAGQSVDYANGETDRHVSKAKDPMLIGWVKDLHPIHKTSRKIEVALAAKGIKVCKTTISEIIKIHCPEDEVPGDSADGQQQAA